VSDEMTNPTTEPTQADELLPCPKCGGSGAVEHSYHLDDIYPPRDFWHVRVICQGCGMVDTGWHCYGKQEQRVADDTAKQAAEAEAIAAWNTRTQSLAPYVEALREAREDTHLLAMTEPFHVADARYTGERIREAGDRLAKIDAALTSIQEIESHA